MAFSRSDKYPGGFRPFSRLTRDLTGSLIIVDPENSLSHPLMKIFQACGIEVHIFDEQKLALETISPKWTGILLAHFDMPVAESLEMLAKVKQIDPDLPVLITLDHADTPLIGSALQMGAYDVIQKPISDKEFLKIILGALGERRRVLEIRSLQPEFVTREKPVSFAAGQSRIMERLRESMLRASKVNAEVLLVGEPGTGKKWIARYLHENSPKGHKKFIAVNCSSISEKNLEIELFGHQPGAFPGVQYPRMGKFEMADGGTLYLDKIDSLPVRLQDRLLQVLQEKTIARLGSSESFPIEIRVIASTQGDLQKACEGGWFREHLFYRLNVVRIVLPSLRKYCEDIPFLFQHFALRACASYQRPTPLVTGEVIQQLLRRDWPGNVRELKSAAQRFALSFDMDLNCHGNQEESSSPNEPINGHKQTLVEKMKEFEKSLIVQELTRTKGNVKETYLTLGLPRKTFYDKLNKHGLKRKDFLKTSKPSNNGSSLN